MFPWSKKTRKSPSKPIRSKIYQAYPDLDEPVDDLDEPVDDLDEPVAVYEQPIEFNINGNILEISNRATNEIMQRLKRGDILNYRMINLRDGPVGSVKTKHIKIASFNLYNSSNVVKVEGTNIITHNNESFLLNTSNVAHEYIIPDLPKKSNWLKWNGGKTQKINRKVKVHSWDLRYLKHLKLPTSTFNETHQKYLKSIGIHKNHHREFTPKDWKQIKKQISYTDLIDLHD